MTNHLEREALEIGGAMSDSNEIPRS